MHMPYSSTSLGPECPKHYLQFATTEWPDMVDYLYMDAVELRDVSNVGPNYHKYSLSNV